MDPPEGAGSGGCNRVDFDHRVGLEFRGTQISSDGGLPVIRELDDVPGLSGLASVAFLWRCATAAGARPPFTGSTGCFGGWSMDVRRAAGMSMTPTVRSLTLSCVRSVGARAVEAQAASILADGAVWDRNVGSSREPGRAGRPERRMDRPLS